MSRLSAQIEAAVVKAVTEVVATSVTPRWLTQEQCAAYTGISVQQLSLWRMKRQGLPYVRVGARMVRYDRLEVDRFMMSFAVDGEAGRD